MLKKTPSLDQHFAPRILDPPKRESIPSAITIPDPGTHQSEEDIGEQDPVETDDTSNQIQVLTSRVTLLEYQLHTVISLLQQTTRALTGLNSIGLIEKPQTIRSKLVQLVDAYALSQQIDHQEVWRSLYNRLKVDYGFDVWAAQQATKGPYLDSVERNGQLHNLYSIALSSLSPAILERA